MTLLPKTLKSRIVLLILLLLAIGQYAAFRLIDYFELEPRSTVATMQVVSTVTLTRAALLASSEENKLPLLKELNRRQGVRVYPLDPFEEVEPLPREALIQRIAEKTREELGPDTIITLNHLAISGLWVSFSIDSDDYWVVIPRVQTEIPSKGYWLGWGLLVLLLSLMGTWLIMSRINQPLSMLALAADKIGRGDPVNPLVESGVDEFARVARAFNAMSVSLSRMDSDRKLLLGGISHDLRTPLARLRLSVEMLSSEDSMKVGMVQDIDDMDAIIGQFLDFVRGAEGEAAVLADFNELISDVVARYQRTGQSVKAECTSLPLIQLRVLAMRRMVSNLIDNALHYGGGAIVVKTSRGRHEVVLSVMDQGAGLPEQEIERLMRPFERLDVARGREGGAGLGLAIAARITRMHGGTLTLHNRPEGGLEARVSLPLLRA